MWLVDVHCVNQSCFDTLAIGFAGFNNNRQTYSRGKSRVMYVILFKQPLTSELGSLLL